MEKPHAPESHPAHDLDRKESDALGSRDELLAFLEGFDTAMLVTRDQDGAPRARPMAMRVRAHDKALWFVTGHEAPKVHEIERDPLVAAVCYRDGDRAWINVSGRASLIRDVARARELWTPAMKAWFAGPEDPDLLLIRLEPHHAEYYEPKGTKVGRVFELVKGAVTGATPALGPVKHVGPGELHRQTEHRASAPGK